MKKLLFWVLSLGFIVASCADNEQWSTEKSFMLDFSVDTLAFDTLISTVGSSTKTLTLYNHHNKGLNIAQVWLDKGKQSSFRINMDGQYLGDGVGEDFEVRHGDSILIRVEVTPPLTGTLEPQTIEDDLCFRLESGTLQKIHLTVGSQDAHFMHGVIIEHDTIFQAGIPYVVYDSLIIGNGAKLTLEAGVRLMFHEKVEMKVYGSLVAKGTIENPIVFRSDRMDHMFDYLFYDNTPNRWGGIHIMAQSRNNEFYNCDIHSGEYGIVCDSTSLDDLSLYMENSVIHGTGGDGLMMNNCLANFVNTQISNTRGTSVYLFGGGYQFLHCTIAQYYPFTSERGDALFISNRVNDNYRHLYYAYFLNSVIMGYAEDVIMGSIEEGQDYTCDYLFDHCYLRTVSSDDSLRFANIIYDNKDQELEGEKNFQLLDTHSFTYDFTPDSLSLIRGLADPKYTILPFDRLGRSRFTDDGPDAGCYEYQDIQVK